MNKEQLQQDIEAIKVKLASMEQQLQECGKLNMFPQEGDKYWTYFGDGSIEWMTARKFNYCNAYRTKEEAERARDIAFAKQRLKSAIEVANKGWVPNWNCSSIKYTFFYETNNNTLSITYYTFTKHQPNWMYMKSKEIAECILKEYKADIKLIFSE